jgi:hypothetical protein
MELSKFSLKLQNMGQIIYRERNHHINQIRLRQIVATGVRKEVVLLALQTTTLTTTQTTTDYVH